MRLISRLTGVCVLILALQACSPGGSTAENLAPSESSGDYLRAWNKALSDVMVHDIVSPPVASRNYAYPNIAAYEVLAHLEAEFLSLSGQLREFEPTPEPTETVSGYVASSVAFSRVAQALVFDGTPLAQREDSLLADSRSRFDSELVEASVAYGASVAEAVLAYARADNYAQTRTMPQFVVNADDPGRWQPTPPDYVPGLEPNWNRLRPFTLASVDEFQPPPPPPFDTDPSSPFYAEMMEVYEAVAEAEDEHVEIAKFWDCNPLVSTHIGHVMTFSKKITPGGHWIGITKIATSQAGLDAMRTAEAYALTSIALADGFISCWDEKYRSNLIRPETVINQYVDPEWRPVLQTPPFPEYTSGHSVISGAASTVLTGLLGEPFPFLDDTEVEFGLPARSFESFRQAADEAAISRMYGGIHYRQAIEVGVAQGRSLGEAVLERVQTRVTQDFASTQ